MSSSWIADVTVSEARGNIAPPAPIDQCGVVFGTYSGNGTANTLSPLYASAASLIAAEGEGAGVTAAAYVIAQYGIPIALLRAASTTPGSYDTIDNTAFLGTAVPAVAATTPLNDYEAYIIFPTGTTAIGASGDGLATYKTSLDGGRTLSTLRKLGTADSIDIKLPNGASSGAGIVLNPSSTDENALNTLINELYTDQNAHVILTTGTVHSNADSGDVVSIASATNTATRVARINALVAAALLHYAKGTGASIHINAGGDAAGHTALAALTASTDDESALVNALALKAAHNTHIASPVWHTIADTTNGTTSPAPVAGTILDGAIVRVLCHAPAWATADIDAAASITTTPKGPLITSQYDFAHIYIAGACDATAAGHLTTALNNLKTVGRIVDAVIHTRGPNIATSESEATWGGLIETDFASFNDDRIKPKEGMPTIVIDPVTAQIWHRTWAYWYFAAMLAAERGTWVGSPAGTGGAVDPTTGQNLVSLYDSSGVRIGHDEGPGGSFTGLGDANGSGNRFGCLVRGATQATRNITYTTVPWVLWTTGGRIFTGWQRNIANAIERAALEVSFQDLGDTVFYDTDPNTNVSTFQPEYQNSVHHVLFSALTGSPFENDIENSADDDPLTGFVQVQSVVTVANGGLVSFNVILAPKIAGKILHIGLTYAAQ